MALFEKTLDILKIFFRTLGILKMLFLFIFISFLIYIEKNTKSHLVKYDGIPCQNNTFSIDNTMRRVIGGESTMRKGYYHITQNILHDINDDYQTVKKTNDVYQTGSQFKVISYYVAFDSGPLSSLGGGPVPEYLVQSLIDKQYFWVSYFDFDSKLCKVTNDHNATHFDISESRYDKNISKTIIEI
jgi:hypothetical protein